MDSNLAQSQPARSIIIPSPSSRADGAVVNDLDDSSYPLPPIRNEWVTTAPWPTTIRSRRIGTISDMKNIGLDTQTLERAE